MKDRVKVKFWLDGHVLYVQREKSEEVKTQSKMKKGSPGF